MLTVWVWRGIACAFLVLGCRYDFWMSYMRRLALHNFSKCLLPLKVPPSKWEVFAVTQSFTAKNYLADLNHRDICNGYRTKVMNCVECNEVLFGEETVMKGEVGWTPKENWRFIFSELCDKRITSSWFSYTVRIRTCLKQDCYMQWNILNTYIRRWKNNQVLKSPYKPTKPSMIFPG